MEPRQFAADTSLHAEVGRTMLKGTPMITVGTDVDLRDLQAQLSNMLGSERTVFRKDINLYIPQQAPEPEWIWV